jgi:hypothetical protein
MATKRNSHNRTVPGLGPDSQGSSMGSAKMERVRAPAPSGVDRREEPADLRPSKAPKNASRPPSTNAKSKSWRPEVTTGARRKYEGPASKDVKVDEVGEAAVKIARAGLRESGAPKLAASRAMIAQAPIDARAAFVLSLVDGRNTVESLIDMAGMPEAEVRSILARLQRLGLIRLG